VLLLLGKVVLVLLLLCAFLATLLGLPGTIIVAVLATVWGLCTGFASVKGTLVLVLWLVAIASEVLDQVLGAWGVRKYEGSPRGMWGAWGGGILGAVGGGAVAPLTGLAGPGGFVIGAMVVPMVGGLIGGFAGALLLEMTHSDKGLGEAARSGFGAFLGRTVGMVVKIGVCAGMVVAVLLAVLRG